MRRDGRLLQLERRGNDSNLLLYQLHAVSRVIALHGSRVGVMQSRYCCMKQYITTAFTTVAPATLQPSSATQFPFNVTAKGVVSALSSSDTDPSYRVPDDIVNLA